MKINSTLFCRFKTFTYLCVTIKNNMTIHRYIKKTIRNQQWEIRIEEHENGTYIMTEMHERTDCFKVLKDVTKTITKELALKYMEANKDFHVETYSIKS